MIEIVVMMCEQQYEFTYPIELQSSAKCGFWISARDIFEGTGMKRKFVVSIKGNVCNTKTTMTKILRQYFERRCPKF